MISISLFALHVLGLLLGQICAAASIKPGSTSIGSHVSLVHRRDVNLKLGRRNGRAAANLTEDEGFWFANVEIGGSKELSLLIDTGSSDIIVNPGHYKKGSSGKDLHISFNNSYGTTNSDGSGSGSVSGPLFSDIVTYAGLSVRQTIGEVNQNIVPHDGLAGFAGVDVAQFPNDSPPFFHTLCTQANLPECRFGMVLGKDNTGVQVLGTLDNTLFDGELVTTKIIQEWAAYGDLAINGKIFATDLPIELDSGTATIVGPVDDVLALFKATNITAVRETTPDGDTVTGYFPCDQPPTVGFSFPSQSDVKTANKQSSNSSNSSNTLTSRKPKVFNLDGGGWILTDNGDNNCTAAVSGYSYPAYPTLWVVGQVFFRDLYIDHNVGQGTVGFARQKKSSRPEQGEEYIPGNLAKSLRHQKSLLSSVLLVVSAWTLF